MNLDQIRSPKDLRGLTHAELDALSAQIRERIIQVVSRNGGHLASNLGIVELTLALHRVFESPQDRIIFDVGHQCYTHKLITGRIDPFPTLRTLGGLSGFPKICESPHDAFDTGHSSTSISAALGMALARDHFDQAHKIVAIIGDGAMTGGMAFEALNYAGHKRSPFIVVLNDNAMSISPNVGGLSHYLHKIRMEPMFTTPKEYLSHVVKQIPGFGSRVYQILSRLEGSLKYLLTPGSLFEELGFRYLGPINGYDFALMEQTFSHARQCAEPILIHVLTEKGRGYKPAQDKLPQFHGVGPFEITTGEIIKDKAPPSYSAVFGQTLVEMARADNRIVAITAAMKEGTGLAAFAQHFPERFYDVGIAEQNAVTMAAGMAAAGLRPFVAVYSTFLQRAYDQVIHDVALMNLPVVFCLDRAGLVGEDGPTHHGVFDVSFLRSVPNLVLMAPRNEAELDGMLHFSGRLPGPAAVRYPRGPGLGIDQHQLSQPIVLGKAEICRDGKQLAILSLGTTTEAALQAASTLAHQGIDAMVVNPRFIKPLDTTLLESIFRRRIPIVTVEEGTLIGGFGSAVLETASELGYTPAILRIGLPDHFATQGSLRELRAMYGLDADGIVRRISEWFSSHSATMKAAC